MTPRQLYDRDPETTDDDISILWGTYYCHIPEFDEALIGYYQPLISERIQIKYYKNHCFDGRRVWILASVWFDEKPVMIIQNAGREGDDWAERFITDQTTYNQMLEHIKTLIPLQSQSENDLYDIDAEFKKYGTYGFNTLTSFYGYHLDGYFEHW